MAEYREIFGEAVQSLPSATGTIEGQIWYDSGNNALKLIALNPGVWTTGNNMAGTPLRNFQSTGSYTSAVVNGGVSSTAHINQTNEWDGTNWAVTTSNTYGSQGKGGGGTSTAGIIFGGVFSLPRGLRAF